MRLLSSKEVTDLFTDGMIKRVGELYNHKFGDFNIRYLKSSVQIRNILQQFLVKEADRYIDNAYSKKPVNINHVFNTVYQKGGIIIDYFITGDVNSIVMSDLDYQAEIYELKNIKPNFHEVAKTTRKFIQQQLDWIASYFNDIIEGIVVNKVFDGEDTLEIYNAYNHKQELRKFCRHKIRIDKPKPQLNFEIHVIKEDIVLIRYFYLYKLKDTEIKSLFNLKINIVDFSMYHPSDYLERHGMSILQLTYFTKTDFIITSTKLGLLNDQIKTLVNGLITGSTKIEKRKMRIRSLLNIVTHKDIQNTNVFICKYNQIPPEFDENLKNNIIFNELVLSKMYYPFILIPFAIWFSKNKKYIHPMIYTPQKGEFYYKNNIVNASKDEVIKVIYDKINEFTHNIAELDSLFQEFYDKIKSKYTNESFIRDVVDDFKVYEKLNQLNSHQLLQLYHPTSYMTKYRNNHRYWAKFKGKRTDIDDEHYIMYSALLKSEIYK